MADYHYYHCGKQWSEAVDDYVRQPCPECGERVDPYRVTGVPFVRKEYQQRYHNTFGRVVKSAKEERILQDQFGVVPMTKQEWTKTIKEPVEHELWKQDQGLPAFQVPEKLPSVREVAEGLERARWRLANDDNYRKQHDPNHPEFKHANRGPEDRTP